MAPETASPSLSATSPTAGRAPGLVRRTRGRRRWIVSALVAVVAAAGIALGVTDSFRSGRPTGVVTDNPYPTSTATVTRQDLASETPVNATLGYAGDYSVVNQASGTLTALPQLGEVVSEGQVLYEVNGEPVILLYGSTPAYRNLSEGTSTAVTGPDVAKLNADLVALGYATSSEIPTGSDVFSSGTQVGVEKLQSALGLTANGTLSLGQVVFLPSAARITTISATLGASAPAGQAIMSATSTTRVVTVDLDAAQQSEVKTGDHVSITLPNNQTTPGVVTSVGTVATSSSSSPSAGVSGSSSSNSPNSGGSSGAASATIIVLVSPTDAAATGTWDQAPVTVAITTASVKGVLAVPVDALLALSDGGYAVEVVGAHGVHHLVSVNLGIFDDAQGLVQVSGPGLSAGERVVVPAV